LISYDDQALCAVSVQRFFVAKKHPAGTFVPLAIALSHDKRPTENSTSILLKTMRGDDYKSSDLP
jgi:hypothetical protein